jgi:hypothetical protein
MRHMIGPGYLPSFGVAMPAMVIRPLILWQHGSGPRVFLLELSHDFGVVSKQIHVQALHFSAVSNRNRLTVAS